MELIRGKFDQARFQGCHGWHWAIELDEDMNPKEFKCCRCGRLIPFKIKVRADGEAVVGKN